MKQHLLLTSVFSLFVLIAWAQPANDNCADATTINQLDGSCSTFDNTGATADMNPSACTNGLNLNVWFTFQAQGVSAIIDVLSGIGDAEIVLAEFNPTPCDQASFVVIDCADGADPTLEVDNVLTIGNTYWIGVAFGNNAEGSFDICVDNPVPAPNDDCTNATPLSDIDGNCTSYNNDYPSTDVLIPGCFDPNYTYNVWYSFVAQGVSLIVEIPSGPDNAQFAVVRFNTPCDPTGATVLGCQTGTNQIVLDNQLIIGTTYYVVVGFDNNAVGSFDLCVDNPVPAFNDDCSDAPVIPPAELDDEFNCITSIGGNPLNNDYPATDLFTFGCWDMGETYNVWFQFVAQGPDVNIEIGPTFGTDAEQIALVEFTGNPCETAGAVLIECSNGADLVVADDLEVGNTYFIGVGFDNNQIGDYCINVFNPKPPPNDTACAAVPLATDGSCNSGPCPGGGDCYTTQYANPEINPASLPAACQATMENTVWYTIALSDPNNVGFTIDLSSVTAGDLSLIIGTFNDCNSTFFIEAFYCGETFPVDFGPVDETETYYLMVGTEDDPAEDGNFQICVEEIPPCFDNNFCDDPVSAANDLGVITSQSLSCPPGGPPPDPWTCVVGCNLFADPEPGLTQCLTQNSPAVWYQFTTDGIANILNMNVTTNEFSAPSLSLFLQGGGGPCDLIGPIGLTEANLACVPGTGGVAIANSTPISASATYYVVVGGINTAGGNFELCINTLEQSAACVTSSEVEVTGRSFGGPLEGPFLPGETVSICLNVNNFQVAGGAQNCQWFQGIVPVFGNGWDPSSFDGDGQPMNSTMNGNNFPANNVHNSGQFDWWTDVTYHHPHCFYNVGDFDGNGTLDICNALFDEDCQGPGFSGGCCQPCWTSMAGDLLPPGWFTSGVTGLCGMDGHPTWDWGDGNTCSGPTGPWEFCFDLTVRDYPDCNEDMTTMDLTVGFVTFADGEVGSWNGGPSVCGQDEPNFVKFPMCCAVPVTFDDVLDPICTNGTIQFTLDEEEVDFWVWTVDATNVSGAQAGSGNNPVTVINTLNNNTTSTGFVTYNILGYAGGECPAAIVTVNVEVYPDIDVELTPFTACSNPNNAYTITPSILGGSGNYNYNWNDGSSGSNLTVDMPSQGTQYCITVTDDVGCEGTDCVVLDVYSTFEVDVSAPVTGQCLSDGGIEVTADANSPLGGYNFEWTLPGGGSANTQSVTGMETGWYVVTATDNDGCKGRDSIFLEFWESPDVDINPPFVSICPDQEGVQIFAIAVGGEQPYNYEWLTPDGLAPSTSFVTAEVVGVYYLTVTDNNGCTATIDYPVEEADVPEPDLGPDITECVVTEAEITTSDHGYLFYEWSTGQSGPSLHTIQVPGVGSYIVTVTSDDYCTGTDEIVVSEFDQPVLDLPDTVTFCTNSSVTLDAGPGWESYHWSTNSNSQEIEVFNPGLYFVEVTDENDCIAEEEIEVIETGFLSFDITGDTVICFNGSVVLVTDDDYALYEWSDNGSNDEENIVSDPGWYYLTVTDFNGCSGVDSIEIHLGEPDPVITGNLAICDGESATLDVGSGFSEVKWSTEETTSMIEVTTDGTYSVTVTDDLGCTAETDVLVQVGSNPLPDILGDITFCSGTSTTLSADQSYTGYVWSTGETTESIEVSTSGMIILEVINAEGCVGSDTVMLEEVIPETPNITGDTSICNNVAVTLDAGMGFADYAWSTGAATQTVDISTPGIIILTVTDDEGCTSTDQIEVIASAPAPVISGDNELCEGESTVLVADAGWASYEWSGGEMTPTISASATGDYTVTVTDQYGCTGTASFALTVHDNPAPTITGSTQFCTGGSTTLGFAATWNSYLWSTGESTPTIIVTTPGDIIATVTDAKGCVGTAAISVIEATELSPQIDGDTALCTGTPIVLDAGSGYETYVWGPDGETTESIVVTTAGTYTLTVSDASGCTGDTSLTVAEYSEPFADVTTLAEICNTTAEGSVFDFSTLLNGGDTGGTWTDSDNSGASGSFPVLDFNGVDSGQYVFTYTTASAIAPCEDQSYTVTLDVNYCVCPSPQIDSPSSLCNDSGTMDLTDLYIAGITTQGGTWAIVSTPGGSNPATVNGSNFDASGADPGMYTIQYTLPTHTDGCPDSAEVQLTVVPFPDAGIAGEPAMVCAEEDSVIMLAALLSGSDPGGMWVESSVMQSTGGAFDDQAGSFSTVNQAPGLYTFDYIVSGAAPCGEDMTTIEVMIEELPNADAGSPFELTCAENTVALGGTGTSTGSNFTYMWTSSAGSVNNPTALNPVVGRAGTYTLEVTNNITGCKSYDDVVITASSDIPSDVDYDLEAPRCFGDPPASLEVTEVIGGTPPYSFSLDSVTFGSSPVYSDLAPGDYTLYVLDANGCATQTNFSIDSVFEQHGTLEGELLVDEGDATTLTFTYTPGIPDSVVWMVDGILFCANCDSIQLEPESTTEVMLILYDENLCEIIIRATLIVRKNRDIFIPNVFSPNGDGINDFFTIYPGTEGTMVNSMRIFTRWGEVVYFDEEFNPLIESEGWDGTFAGKEMNPGVYVYYVEIEHPDGLIETLKGDITLIR